MSGLVAGGARYGRIMETTQLSAERVLPPGPGRRAEAEEWLGSVLKAWAVRSSSTGRWLSAAQASLESKSELVMFVQYDALLLLFTIELWRDGDLVYGIDDWLG